MKKIVFLTILMTSTLWAGIIDQSPLSMVDIYTTHTWSMPPEHEETKPWVCISIHGKNVTVDDDAKSPKAFHTHATRFPHVLEFSSAVHNIFQIQFSPYKGVLPEGAYLHYSGTLDDQGDGTFFVRGMKTLYVLLGNGASE